jgi:RNA polymerase sigma-70 factor (ECF subfamily)
MDTKNPSEPAKALVARAQEGDNDAFSGLVEKYRSPLECWIHLRLGPRLRGKVEVQDIVQETFLKAYVSLPTFRWSTDGSFFHWLGAIAEHVIQNFARKLSTKKRGSAREVALTPDMEPRSFPAGKLGQLLERLNLSPSTVLRSNERFERLEKALNTLKPDRREVVVLAILREVPIKEIAARMGRKPDAVSMLLLRALGQLRVLFGMTESLHLPDRLLECDAGRNGNGTDPPGREDGMPAPAPPPPST